MHVGREKRLSGREAMDRESLAVPDFGRQDFVDDVIFETIALTMLYPIQQPTGKKSVYIERRKPTGSPTYRHDKGMEMSKPIGQTKKKNIPIEKTTHAPTGKKIHLPKTVQ